MRQRGLILMLVGILAAVFAGLMVFLLSNSQVKTPEVVVATVTPVPVEVGVIAAHDIELRSVITNSDVVTREYPVGLLPQDAFKDVREVLSRTATVRVLAGEVLVQRQFIEAGARTGFSTQLPPGKVLVGFPAKNILTSIGAVIPGDRVDILVTLPVSGTAELNSSSAPAQEQIGAKFLVSQATLQNVEVYSMGTLATDNNNNGSESGGVMTFILDHQEALILKYIKDSGGTIDLVVRSIREQNAATTDPVSLDYLVDLFHFVNVQSR